MTKSQNLYSLLSVNNLNRLISQESNLLTTCVDSALFVKQYNTSVYHCEIVQAMTLHRVQHYTEYSTLQSTVLYRVYHSTEYNTLLNTALYRIYLYRVHHSTEYTTLQSTALYRINLYRVYHSTGYTTLQGTALYRAQHSTEYSTLQSIPLYRVHPIGKHSSNKYSTLQSIAPQSTALYRVQYNSLSHFFIRYLLPYFFKHQDCILQPWYYTLQS